MFGIRMWAARRDVFGTATGTQLTRKSGPADPDSDAPLGNERRALAAERAMAIYEFTAKAIESLSDACFADLGLKEREDLQSIPRDRVDLVAPGAV